MKAFPQTLLILALAAALAPAVQAQSSADLLKELQALKDRVGELEKKLQAAEANKPADKAQWGMTPEQAAEFNRISVKTEALEDSRDDLGFKGLKIGGYIEPVFIYNHLQQRAGFQFLNQQGDGYFYDTSFMGAAVLDITKETEGGSIWKLTLAPNRGVGAAIDGISIVQEASVSIPLGDPSTRLLVGQVPDWSGYEYQQPTLNPFTTHNLLYDFTLPLGYTGVGMDVTRGDWWLRGMVGNVNATNRQAFEKSPSVALRVDYAKGEFSGFGGAMLVGKSPNFNTGYNTMAVLLEVDGYNTLGDLLLQGQVSYGQQKQGAITPDAEGNYRDSRWFGVSALAGYMVTPRFQMLARADYIRNNKNGGGLFTYNGYSFVDEETGELVFGNDGRNGLGPDLAGDLDRGANRYALSFGLKYTYNQSTTFKAEYRLDGADRAVFEDLDNGGFRKINHLLGTSVVVAF
jgi:hypothetical protein